MHDKDKEKTLWLGMRCENKVNDKTKREYRHVGAWETGQRASSDVRENVFARELCRR